MEDWEIKNRRAIALHVAGDYEAAYGLAMRACSIAEGQFDKNHPSVGYCLNTMGLASQGLGNYAEAESYFQRAKSILEGHLGKEHCDAVGCTANLADLWRITKQYDRAENVYKCLEKLWESSSYGVEDYAIHHNNYANLLSEMGKLELAAQICENGLARIQTFFGNKHRLLAPLLTTLGDTYFDLGRIEDAERILIWAGSVSMKYYGTRDLQFARSMGSLAYVLLSKPSFSETDFEKVIYAARSSYDTRAALLAANDPELLESLVFLARAYKATGYHEKAKESYLKLVSSIQGSVSSKNPLLEEAMRYINGSADE